MLHNKVITNRKGRIMPPKAKYTREEIVQKAFEMTREKGIEAVVAREHRLRRFLLHLRTWKNYMQKWQSLP